MKYFLVVELESNEWPTLEQGDKAAKEATRVLDQSPGITSEIVTWSIVELFNQYKTKDARLIGAVEVASKGS